MLLKQVVAQPGDCHGSRRAQQGLGKQCDGVVSQYLGQNGKEGVLVEVLGKERVKDVEAIAVLSQEHHPSRGEEAMDEAPRCRGQPCG